MSKVVLIGTGFVGMSFAYSALNKGSFETLVLIDVNHEKAVGEAMDLNHGLAFAPRKMHIYAGDYQDCKNADIVVITAGVNQKPGETRLDLLKRNAEIMKAIVKQVMSSGFNGIFLVATNPVDILTYVVYEASGLPKTKVIGSGTSLDTARLRYEVAKRIHIDVRNVHAYILGEHGDSEFVCWSNANVGSKPIMDVIETIDKIKFEDLQVIADDVRNAAYEIISRKQATYYGIGMALNRIVMAILNNDHAILPLSVLNEDEYDCDKVYIGLPAVVNRDGIDHIVKLKLSDEEKVLLKKSSQILKDAHQHLT
ncbi:MAG: L-lactate dehydrogenase [Acholeplasmataceae bacterium]